MTITELQQYVDTQDNSLRFEFQRMYEDFTHEVTHILNDYEDYLTGRIGSIHEEVWEGVDSTLSTTSTAPVQNKVITNALNGKAASSHTHDNRYYTETEINNLLNSKVNIEEGKGLSANNYTDTDKATVAQARNLILNSGSPVTGVKGDAEPSYRVGDINITKANIGLNNVNNTSDVDKPISTATQTALNNKVDKVSGKGLSTNDFTNAYKQQLDTLDSTYSIQLDEILSTGSQNPVKNRTITNALNLKAPLSSPAFTGIPTAPTATAGTNTTQIATTAFVQAAITNNAITIDIDDALNNNSSNPVENQVITAALNNKAPLNNAALTGTPTAPTAAAGTNTTQIATTGFVQTAINNYTDIFKAGYLTTAEQLYDAYSNNKYIYFYANNKNYICTDINISNQVLISIQFVHISGSVISKITGAYDTNNNFNYTLATYTIPDLTNVEFSTYPTLSDSVNSPPSLNKQFVTKEYVDSLGLIVDNTLSASSANPVQNQAIVAALDEKIDIDPNRGLSTNDFTDELKDKLDNINPNLIASDTDLYKYGLIHPLGYPILTITSWDTSREDCDFCTGKVRDYGGNEQNWNDFNINSSSIESMRNSWAPVANYPLITQNLTWITTINDESWRDINNAWLSTGAVNINNCLSTNITTLYSGKQWRRNCTYNSADDIYTFQHDTGIYFRIYNASVNNNINIYFDIVVPKGTGTPFVITLDSNWGYTIPEHYNKVPTLTIGNTTIDESQLQQLLQLI